jgi:magnesium transporter
MLKGFMLQGNSLHAMECSAPLPDSSLWLDVCEPTEEDIKCVEDAYGISLPSREEVLGIEISNRVYLHNGSLYITTMFLSHTEARDVRNQYVTFILQEARLITLRHGELKAFDLFKSRVEHHKIDVLETGFDVFSGLIDAFIDELSDTLEYIGQSLDKLSNTVFKAATTNHNEEGHLQKQLRRVGRYGDLNGKARESLIGLNRVFNHFLDSKLTQAPQLNDVFRSLSHDTHSLEEHSAYLNDRVNLILDATLGMISIEQNTIIKVLSVASVAFLPPTLIASIYGMNFEHMPELKHPMAYPVVLIVILLSGILPYLYFKKRKWF